MNDIRGWAAFDATSPLGPYRFQRRDVGPKDVRLEILYCGICHSDLHTVRSEWGPSLYPLVPGHEIVGRVAEVGAEVTRFRMGELAGVGCMVDSCRACASCIEGAEQYCEVGATLTYGSPLPEGGITQGGYSTGIVVDEAFTLRVPQKERLETVAPLLCAGITTFSPLRRWKVGKGQKVAVVGLGGLGHVAVKLAAAMGAEVTVLSSSERKRVDAKRLGAEELVITSDDEAMKKRANRFDFILDTVSAPHDPNRLLALLKRDGAMVLVGAPPEPLPVRAFSLIRGRRTLAGSLIGGVAETQEMLDFCATHGVGADVELIEAAGINAAYERLSKGDVRYRFVIDAKSFA